MGACWQAFESSHVRAGAVGLQRPSILLDSSKGGRWQAVIGLACMFKTICTAEVPSSPQRRVSWQAYCVAAGRPGSVADRAWPGGKAVDWPLGCLLEE